MPLLSVGDRTRDSGADAQIKGILPSTKERPMNLETLHYMVKVVYPPPRVSGFLCDNSLTFQAKDSENSPIGGSFSLGKRNANEIEGDTVKLIKKLFSPFFRDSRGVSTVEYALILVAVVAIVGTGMVLLGGQFKTLFGAVGNELTDQTGNVQGINMQSP